MAEAPVVIQDEAHYISWTKKVLGAKGEKTGSSPSPQPAPSPSPQPAPSP